MNNNYEYDGLVYKPLIQSVIPQENESEDTIYDFLGQETQESNFPVEPVREWIQPDNFDWTNYERPEHYNTGESVGTGRIYKTSEKDAFKMDLFEAYTTALKARGFDEDRAIEFAKRITAQDALESRYGQSSLSKYYNFGGVKDFREGSDVYFVNTVEHQNGNRQVKKQPFRKFKNLDEYVEYKLNLLGNNNYNVFSYAPEKMYRRLTTAKRKYATDPDYERKLNNVYYLLWRR